MVEWPRPMTFLCRLILRNSGWGQCKSPTFSLITQLCYGCWHRDVFPPEIGKTIWRTNSVLSINMCWRCKNTYFLDAHLLQTYARGPETGSTWDNRWLPIRGHSMGDSLEVDDYWQRRGILHYLVWFTLYGRHVIIVSLVRGSWIVWGFIGAYIFMYIGH